jgi:acetolactate synthase I/II/III large subunit
MLASKSSDVRCRPIAPSDLDEVVSCLTRGFPERAASYWTNALERLAKRDTVDDYPRYGYLMEASGEVVGVILLIFSRRLTAGQTEIHCNLSSWCVDPEYRGYALALPMNGVRCKGVTYTNISAAPHTRPGIEAMGFQLFSSGLFVFAPLLSRSPAGARVVAYCESAPEAALLDPSERQILAEHAAFGCRALIGVNKDRAVGFVLQSRPLLYGGAIPCERLIHCRDVSEVVAFAGAIGRHLVKRGVLLCLIDASGPVPGLIGKFLRNREPKYFRGPAAPALGDLAYSELVLLGRRAQPARHSVLTQPSSLPRSAAQVLVDHLVANEVRHVFCVPGESFLAALDALRDREVTITVCRNEAGAAMMAEAIGKATGRPGVCFVTRGPGATNASPGVHIARHDSTPMILFVGQIERAFRDRDAFQEVDYRAFFGSMTKWVVEIDDARRIPEVVSRAFQTALEGRPGPVVVSLPRDMLTDSVTASDARASRAIETAPAAADIAAFADRLAGAREPVLILGGTRWNEAALASVAHFAERFELPVVTSYRRGTLFDSAHPNYAGDLGIAANPKLVARIKRSDMPILLGGRMGEIPSQGFTLFDMPRPRADLVHIHPAAEEFGRLYQAALSIHASPIGFAQALDRLAPSAPAAWSGQASSAHADYLAWTQSATPQPGAVNLGEVMIWLRDHTPADVTVCNGAGNYAAWIHRFFRFRRFNAHIAPTSASMGYGVPAAVAIQRLHPERLIISINGDGDFLMNGQEFATAVQYRLPIIVIVCDNASYGTIRMHQEREFPGRVVATDLVNPDFAAYAKAFGGVGFTVERTQDFPAAFEAARAAAAPAIIHLKMSVDAILPATTLEQIKAKAMAQAAAIT